MPWFPIRKFLSNLENIFIQVNSKQVNLDLLRAKMLMTGKYLDVLQKLLKEEHRDANTHFRWFWENKFNNGINETITHNIRRVYTLQNVKVSYSIEMIFYNYICLLLPTKPSNNESFFRCTIHMIQLHGDDGDATIT